MNFIQQNGLAKIIKKTNLRKDQPSTQGKIIREMSPNQTIKFVGWIVDGENVSGNSRWFKTEDGSYFWSGNVEVVLNESVVTNEFKPITVSQLYSIVAPSLTLARANELVIYLNNTMQEFSINTPIRQAAFIAQTAQECGGYTCFVENLNYSAERLLAVWPKRFTKDKAVLYGGQPQKIANFIYAKINGNGDEASGDGWKYRGRGIAQLTGRGNYKDCETGLGLDLINTPELLEQSLYAFRSGGWFWNSRKPNELADKDDFEGVTMKINGGLNGLEDRKKYYARAKIALGIVPK